MEDHSNRIRQTTKLIRSVGLPEVLDYSTAHVVKIFLVWRPPHGAAAIYNAPEVCGVRRFKIAIWYILDTSRRGHALVHELLHIPFALAGLPKASDLTKNEHRLLEDSIDELVAEAISENPALPAQIWQSLFGFPIDKFT